MTSPSEEVRKERYPERMAVTWLEIRSSGISAAATASSRPSEYAARAQISMSFPDFDQWIFPLAAAASRNQGCLRAS